MIPLTGVSHLNLIASTDLESIHFCIAGFIAEQPSLPLPFLLEKLGEELLPPQLPILSQAGCKKDLNSIFTPFW
jgi:hypothetical protein